MKHIIKQIVGLFAKADSENPAYNEGYEEAIKDVLRIIPAFSAKHTPVIFEFWTVEDLRERIEESEHQELIDLLDKITDEQLFDFLNDNQKPFYTRGDGLDFYELYDQLKEWSDCIDLYAEWAKIKPLNKEQTND